jgi:hypothetical protein
VIDYERMADVIVGILEAARRDTGLIAAEAARRGATAEQLLAAAITEAVRRQVEAAGHRPGGGPGKPRRRR